MAVARAIALLLEGRPNWFHRKIVSLQNYSSILFCPSGSISSGNKLLLGVLLRLRNLRPQEDMPENLIRIPHEKIFRIPHTTQSFP